MPSSQQKRLSDRSIPVDLEIGGALLSTAEDSFSGGDATLAFFYSIYLKKTKSLTV